jgi:class 3 adenylate cyclase
MPGQILVSPRVLMAVEDSVNVEPVGEFAIKGIRRPMVAYNVLAKSETEIYRG